MDTHSLNETSYVHGQIGTRVDQLAVGQQRGAIVNLLMFISANTVSLPPSGEEVGSVQQVSVCAYQAACIHGFG